MQAHHRVTSQHSPLLRRGTGNPANEAAVVAWSWQRLRNRQQEIQAIMLRNVTYYRAICLRCAGIFNNACVAAATLAIHRHCAYGGGIIHSHSQHAELL